MIREYLDRIEWLYLEPAQMLNENDMAFASGLLCTCAIDSIYSVSYKRTSDKNASEWLRDNIPELKPHGTRFWREFRNGLVHEGRIKEGGQFSYKTKGNLWTIDERNLLVINPKVLHSKARRVLSEFSKRVLNSNQAYGIFKGEMDRRFEVDLGKRDHR